jgi:UPF0755 protein
MATMLTRPIRRALLAVVVVVVLFGAWFALQVDPVFAGKGREVIVTVHPGDSLATIAGELHAQGVIASPFAFRLENLALGTPLLRAGSYQFRQGSSFATVRAVLGNLPNVDVVTASPGLTLHEIAVNLANVKGSTYANTFAAAMTGTQTPSPFGSGTSLEGLIGAGTYIIKPSITAQELANEMVQRFTSQAASVGLTPTTTLNGLNAYQLVVAASIVEKEGYYPHNMPKVARVIFNRLAKGGPLQMDATVLYYLGLDGGTVTHAMLQTPTPYNTYLNNGLTPTPICTVSTIALNAVLHAPPGPWLYFTVIDKNGDEAFATTFAQQLKNEQLFTSGGAS